MRDAPIAGNIDDPRQRGPITTFHALIGQARGTCPTARNERKTQTATSMTEHETEAARSETVRPTTCSGQRLATTIAPYSNAEHSTESGANRRLHDTIQNTLQSLPERAGSQQIGAIRKGRGARTDFGNVWLFLPFDRQLDLLRTPFRLRAGLKIARFIIARFATR